MPASESHHPLEFPATTWSAIAAPDADPELRRRHMGRLIELYWKPVFLTLRRFESKNNEEARDLTQEFFLHLLEHEVVEKYEPGRARFRTFLKVVLRSFLFQHRRGSSPRKPLDALRALASFDPPAPDDAERDPDRAFDAEWAATVVDHAVAELRLRFQSPKQQRCLRVFELHDLAETQPTYEEVAGQLAIKVATVRSDLHIAREALRAIIREQLRETVASAADLEEELRLVLEG